MSWRETSGRTHKNVITLHLHDCFQVSLHLSSESSVFDSHYFHVFQDAGTRKAVLLVHYVDLHNDYVHDCRRNNMKFLEMFQSFRYSFRF